jgi:NADPH-dependent 2,4-dienoyl-CoA reductase/sulfur reductase-like enzyme/rhodanese-related sulfurtransferase
MAKQKNIVIIGGTACGPKAAARARRLDQAAKITIIEQRKNLSTATCGLPYFLNGLVKESDLVARGAEYFRNVFNMDVLTGTKAVSINREAHNIETADTGTEKRTVLEYDKLVIAAGAIPFVPNLQGRELKGIFTLNNIPDIMEIQNFILNSRPKTVVIVGAGLIGIEAAENLVNIGLKVTILEALGWLLPGLLDYEIAAPVEKQLRTKGIDTAYGQRVSGFQGDTSGKVQKVISGNISFDADMVIMALGVRPNTELATKSGLKIGLLGGIEVNEYLQTSDPDIYAGGDCVEVTNIITNKKILAPMGSTANKHGRIIGTNVTGGKETFPGVAGTAAVKVFDLNIGKTGLNETQARKAGFDILTTLIPTFDHATYYPNAKEVLFKIIADKNTGKILGGQAVGPGDTIKRIDVLATALSFGATVDTLANIDLAYAPPYNSSMDPLHNAANVIRNKQNGITPSLTPEEVKQKLDNNEKFILLDVRSQAEWNAQHIDASQVKLVPLPELRKRIVELPKEQEIVTICRTSVRAYQAQRILMGAGFNNVKVMDGSMTAWPYAIVSVPKKEKEK